MKFIGALSSLVTGVLAFICLSITNVGGELFGLTTKTTGWDIIQTSTDNTNYVVFKIFAIIGAVIAGILILYALFMLLVDLKTVKAKTKFNLNLFGTVLILLFVVCSVVCFIEVSQIAKNYINGFIGIGAWLMLIIPAVMLLCSLLGALTGKKRK